MKTIYRATTGEDKIGGFVFRLLIMLPLFMLAVFLFKITALAEKEETLIITELLPNPSGTPEKKNEFIEIYNSTQETIDLTGWYFYEDPNKFELSGEIGAGEYKAFYDTLTLYNSRSTLSLFNPDSKLIAEISYPTPSKEDFSYSLILGDWLWTSPPSPEKENPVPENNDENENASAQDEKSPYADKIKINEIKADTSDEFIEIINTSQESIDFSDWCIKDETLHKKENWSCKKMPDPTPSKANQKIYTFYGKFSLNNTSSGDSVYLYDENKKLVDSVSYANAKKNCYYAFDGDDWRWTSRPTPEKENAFDPKISSEIKKNKNIYSNVYAEFSAKMKGPVKKFRWDFGDKHKSYLEDTRHKYEKAKKYNAALTVFGDCEEKVYDFTVNVKKFEAPKIRIKKISPNPKGNDSQNEWIEIENKSKKKVNLKGWSVATGWDKLYNHPVREKFEIKKGKTKRLTRDLCAFTLANSKTKIELRDPSGKVVQKIKYDRAKNKMEEDTLYEKEDGGNWAWIETPKGVQEKQTGAIANKSTETPLPPPEIPLVDIGKYTSSPDWKKKINKRKAMINYPAKIILANFASEQSPCVLGVYSIKNNEDYYALTQYSSQKHWFLKIVDDAWGDINFGLNKILNVL